MNRLWLLIDERFHFRATHELFETVLRDTAHLNSFHPICDYLAGLPWDGVARIDRWLTTYGGAEDTEYARAVGALMLVAAVRRVRQPGCKFVEMCILEHPIQGTHKSEALRTLAVRDSWFSDDFPLHAREKRKTP